MGRTELIKKLSAKMYGNLSPKNVQECSEFCDSVVEIIKEAIMNGEKITWSGFMTIDVKDCPPRKGRNPQTNEVVTFPACKKISCKISKDIKKELNEK